MEHNYLREVQGKLSHDPHHHNHHPASAGRCILVSGPIIVGAGPSGMAAAACLKEKRIPSLILERSNCIASLWQHRTYDRLRLHLPKQFCELPMMPFPREFPTYPTKQQFVGYMEEYASRFGIRPVFKRAVTGAEFDGTMGMWRVKVEVEDEDEEEVEVEYVCRWLVVATGENAEVVVPEMEGVREFGGEVVHTSEYRSGEGYKGKKVLVVGCGNSGMEVCLDLCHHQALPSIVVRDTARTMKYGASNDLSDRKEMKYPRSPGKPLKTHDQVPHNDPSPSGVLRKVHILPREMLGRSTFWLSMWLLKWLPITLVDCLLLILSWLILGDTSRLGLPRPRMGPLKLKNLSGKTPVLDVGTLDKIKSGDIKVYPSISRLKRNAVEFEDGTTEHFDAIILATGYKSNVPSWLKEKNMFSEKDGLPRQPFPNGWKGENGLYAVGFTRRGLLGASMDAKQIARDIHLCWKSESKRLATSTCSNTHTP